jgi:ribosomal protein L11 methyltransferase
MNAVPSYPLVQLNVGVDEEELASLALWELGALGVEQRDSGTIVVADGDGSLVTLVASFETVELAQNAAASLPGRWAAHASSVDGDEWRDAWKAYFKPMRIGERLLIRPSWEPVSTPSTDARVVITLDPGRVFGTGRHESTRLVLSAIERHVSPGVDVLDVGCGSGILGIACLLLGASQVLAIDVDPLAPGAALDNANRNNVGDRMRASTTPVEELDESFALVLANIESSVLVPRSVAIGKRVSRGGLLILSGLLHTERHELLAAYPGLELVDEAREGDWIALVLRREPAI